MVAVVAVVAACVGALVATLVWRGHGQRDARQASLDKLHPLADAAVFGDVSPAVLATVCARRAAELPRCATATATYELGDLLPGEYTVWASVDGHAGARTRVTLAPGQRARVDLAIAGAGDEALVRGTVHDLRGRPIAGALVALAGATATVAATSDRTGGFTGWLPAGAITARASADGYLDGDATATAPGTVDLALEPAGSLAGIVVDAAAHAPVAGADVAAGDAHASSGADGRFVLVKLGAGRYQPTATTLGGFGEADESVRVIAGRVTDDVVITVRAAAAVSGRIVLPTGAGCPAGQGSVWLSQYGGEASYSVDTLDDGVIVAAGVVPGRYQVNVQCLGWTPLVPYPDVVVADSDVDDLGWLVLAGGIVTGRITSHAGAPIADAAVAALGPTDSILPSTHADATGTYTIAGVAPGTFELAVHADGYVAPSRPRAVARIDAPTRVDVVLDPGAAIAGDVVDEAGAPVANADIDAAGDTDRGTAATDAHGAFAVRDLAAGHFAVRADRGWGDAGAPVAVDVAAGAVASVHLVVASDDATLAGTVRDAAGAAVADVRIDCAREDADGRAGITNANAVTGDDGRFAIAHVPAHATFAVHAAQPGGGEALATGVRPGDAPVLTLDATATIAGIVVATDNSAPDDATIRAIPRGVRRGQAERSERAFHTGGRFVFHDLPPGDYRLDAGDPRGAQRVSVAAGEQRADVRLVVHPRFTVRGRLVAATTGAALAGWRVTAPQLVDTDAGDGAGSGGRISTFFTVSAVTRGDGQFVLHGLPAGPTTLSVAAPDAADDAPLRDVTLAGADEVDLGDVAAPAPPP